MSDEPPIAGENEPTSRPAPIFRVVPNPFGPEIDTGNPEWAYTAKDAEDAVANVRRLEPDWQPGETMYSDTQGAIAANRAVQAEAEARLAYQHIFRFGDNGPPTDPNDPASEAGSIAPETSLESFRAMTGMPDLGGRPAKVKEDGTVAKADIGGEVAFGVNSGAPTYTQADYLSAVAMRDQLQRKYPGLVRADNPGWKPADALFHAEATSLMRWARAVGGSLRGRSVEIVVDRDFCSSCERVVPLLALELGDPEVTIRDPSGIFGVAKGGHWKQN